ncbi:E1a-binding protein p400 [Plakobranchus ocellatus]|uniref:E1a-binding protein p400 n=1 Tax=Plakobranchus ocellatus TaxID=259542 RepID=A0AAV3ZLZ3_9GAST|nr:E1a-binding protein p400 [Plakobranchus ocellatus]
MFQMFISELDGAEMPMWCPPTPPQDDNDIYMDETLSFLYEARVMPEQALPPVYVPKAHKKPKMEAITTRKQKQRKEEQPRVPRSLFDKPKEVVMKQRRDAKMQRLRHNFQVPTKMIAGRSPMGQQPSQPPTPQPTPIVAKPEPDPNYPEWLVHEEWALLEAVQHIQKLNSDLLIDNPAQIVNWDFVSDFVSVVGRCFRAAKHCRYQYEYFVLPREDGKIVYNIKQKKTPKSIYKTKNNRPLRTEQLYSQEGLRNFSQLYDIRFTAMMDIGSKRPAGLRQTHVNPTAKPTKHALILAEQGINYDQPLLPSQLAARRAERIAMDKKKQQQAAAAQQQQQAAAAAVAAAQQHAQVASVTAAVQDVGALAQRTVQAGLATPGVTPTIQGQQLSSIVSVTPTTVITGQVPKVAVGPGLSAVSIARTLSAAGNIIVNAPAGLQSGPFAAINKRISQAALPTTIAVSANLPPTIRGQRPSTPTITMQELSNSTAITVASVAGARPIIQTTVAASGLAAGQKIAAMTAAGGLQPQLTARSLTPHQINILRQSQQSIIRTQAAGAGGAAQLRAQRLLTPDQLRAQQLKHSGTTQKVITQQLLVPVGRGGQSILQGAKPAGLLRTAALPRMGEEQLQALRMRTHMQAQAGKQASFTLQTAQIIQGQVTPGVATSQTPVALVKSVSASPAVTVSGTIPVTGLAVAQQRAVVASKSPTVSQLQQQRMQLLQQRKVGGQPKVTGLAAGKAGQQIPLLIPQNTRLNTVLTSNQILHQIGLVNKTSGAIQQIITHSSQPTIITQVSQAGGQPITQMKVSLTSGNQSLAPGTPITVTQVTSAGGPGIGLSLSGPGPVKTATITSLEASGTPTSIQVHAVAGQSGVAKQQQSLVTAQAVVAGQQQSLVTGQTLQLQQTGTSAPTSSQAAIPAVSPVQFLQVSSASGQPAQAGSSATQAGTVTSVLRAVSVVSRAQTPTQISLVSTTPAPPSAAASLSVGQTQSAQSTQGASDSSGSAQPHVIAQNVPAPAAMATVVTQTNQPEVTQSTAGGQKASPYAMRTRNTKH